MFETAQRRKRHDRQLEIAAAKVVLEGETTVIDLSRELGIKDATLRRWAKECEEMGEGAFPGNGSPKVDKDYEIPKLRKQVDIMTTGYTGGHDIEDIDGSVGGARGFVGYSVHAVALSIRILILIVKILGDSRLSFPRL